jgi:hypothetical protein
MARNVIFYNAMDTIQGSEPSTHRLQEVVPPTLNLRIARCLRKGRVLCGRYDPTAQNRERPIPGMPAHFRKQNIRHCHRQQVAPGRGKNRF